MIPKPKLRPTVVVPDTSPLIHLAADGALTVLNGMGPVVVPDVVVLEASFDRTKPYAAEIAAWTAAGPAAGRAGPCPPPARLHPVGAGAPAEAQELFGTLLGLFDSVAARSNRTKDTIIGELMFFLRNAYPGCIDLLCPADGSIYTRDTLADALRMRIFFSSNGGSSGAASSGRKRTASEEGSDDERSGSAKKARR